MAIRDIFKKRKPEEKKESVLKLPEKEKKDLGKIKTEPYLSEKEEKKESSGGLKKEQKTERKKIKKQTNIESHRILKGPHVTEKAGDLAEKNKYVFKVFKDTNKIEIKKAIESIYGVNVVSVRIINVFKKKRRLGKIKGFRSGYKKAIVKIKKGQKIEVLPR